jgi:hypothetical protein
VPLWWWGIDELSALGAEEGALAAELSESVEVEFVEDRSATGAPLPPTEVEFPAVRSVESIPVSGATDPDEAEPFSSVEVVFVTSETVPDIPADPVEFDVLAPESEVTALVAAAAMLV